MKNDDVDALFLGPKSENEKFFKKMLIMMVDEHLQWRKDFHPDDKPAISESEKKEEIYKETLERTKNALLELSSKLKESSMPWFSPRYLGQMNSDTLMVANLGYMATILYNPNNCAYEGGPATTSMEIEVGKQLAKMLGYNPEKAWGHITAGGTIANYEGLWMARNAKSFPMAVKEVMPELVKGKSDWQLLNMTTDEILDLIDKTKASSKFDEVRDHSIRGIGTQGGKFGKVLVPQSKHYSWPKAADILGIGQNNFVNIQVGNDFRMDIEHLKNTIDDFISKEIPIMAVITVIGTTEEGAIDKVDEVVKLRDEYQKKGISFYLHIDAAFGGYARSIFLDEDDQFMEYDQMIQKLIEAGVMEINWPKKDVYHAYRVTGQADSITVDPHKMGYIPYAAGAYIARDKRILDLISYFASYVLEKGMVNSPTLLGSYILEGSKPGATAGAVWTAHKAIPLNMTGYGRIIGRSVEGADRLYNALIKSEYVEAEGKKFTITPLVSPDFNIVCFSFNEEGNKSLQAMNDLNGKIFDECSYKSGKVYKDDFITSKTELDFEHYGDAPRKFVMECGIPDSEWDKVQSVRVIRSCVLTPWLISNNSYIQYWGSFLHAMKKALENVVKSTLEKVG